MTFRSTKVTSLTRCSMLIMSFLAAPFLASDGLEQKPGAATTKYIQLFVYASILSMRALWSALLEEQRSLGKGHSSVKECFPLDFDWRYDKRSSDLYDSVSFGDTSHQSMLSTGENSFSRLYKSRPSSNFVHRRKGRNLGLLASRFRAVMFRVLPRARRKRRKQGQLLAASEALRSPYGLTWFVCYVSKMMHVF